MTWTVRILLILLAIGANTAEVPHTAVQAPVLGDALPLSHAEAGVFAEAERLFATIGLELPADLVLSFHESEPDCDGNLGLSSRENGVPRVRVCWSDENPDLEAELQLRALIHELTHAWTNEYVDDVTKALFVKFTESGSWSDRSTAWEDRGTERAAELMSWALLDAPILFTDFEGISCFSWAVAFELLTGSAAPTTISGRC